ncbi:DUF2306 domain-containing protein [Parvularcula sp. LCG005]|uniref:DUF2306 domain-containing protein n=1 Tax=Parvularcula sp. LCG005 TaxID=3078805 RepID=UPI0029422A03|nr:DUF2306 domain-containing protein [Parvularcula sp. LCG005]WOI54594.1 DUF2306 domain-containing protein [Parvularcula sp. LCG005]
MNLDLLWAAPVHIQVHAIAAILAFFLGTIQLIMPKGTLPHRTIGVIWVVLMFGVVISSAFIQHPVEPGDPWWHRFSWIHILTLTTFFALIHGVRRIMQGGPKLRKHARPFIISYIGGLIIAGFFAMMPGRMMHDVIFQTCYSNISQTTDCEPSE